MNELKFEVGKFYRTRSGLKAECIYVIKNKKYGNFFNIENKNNGKDFITSVDCDGRSVFSATDIDIVSEWKERNSFFKAIDGEKAFQMDSLGEVIESKNWCANENKLGLSFETKEELEKHMEYLEVVQKLKERIFELNDNEFPEFDWKRESQYKFSVILISCKLKKTGALY